MKTCFVTTAPPSERGPNQYGFLISRELLLHSVPPGLLGLLVPDRSAQWM